MAIYFFDKNQTLIKIVPESATFEAIQTQELDDDSLLKDTLSVTVKGDEKLLNAEYMAVKSYKGNEQTFDMYRIVTDTTPDKSMSFTGMSLAPYELNGHIIQDLRPTNQTLEYTLNRVLIGTDWRLGYIDDELSNVTTSFYYVSVKEALKELQSLAGCEFVFKVEISGQKITDKWVEVYREMGNRTKKRFNYGTNALTVVRETSKTDIYTALIGRGKGEEVSSADDNESGQAGYGRKITFEDIEWSIEKGNPLDKPIGQYYLELPQATLEYGMRNVDGTLSPRIGIVEFNDEEDPSNLLRLTYEQLKVSARPKVLFKSTVANIGATGIGDTVTIHRHDLNMHYETRVRKVVRNKLNDNKTQIELGDAVITPSTKRAKQNNATIKNLKQELDRAQQEITETRLSADGKTSTHYGQAEPERKRTGDTWYRPHPSIAGEYQMLTWDGSAWELILDTSDTNKVERELEEVIKPQLENMTISITEADNKANNALEKVDVNTELIEEHKKTLDDINLLVVPSLSESISGAYGYVDTRVGDVLGSVYSANQSVLNSLTDVRILADSAFEKAQTNEGTLTTVEQTVDDLKGEISQKVTSADVTTVLSQFNETVKTQTASQITESLTGYAKSTDLNGLATESYARTQATTEAGKVRQELTSYAKSGDLTTLAQNIRTETAESLKSVYTKTETNGLLGDKVSQATYESGIKGVRDSVTTLEGDLAGMVVGGRNLLPDTHSELRAYTKSNWDFNPQRINSNKLEFYGIKVGTKLTYRVYIDNPSEAVRAHIQFVKNPIAYVQYYGNQIKSGGSGYSELTVEVTENDLKNLDYIQIAIRGTTSAQTTNLAKKKLEIGTIPTDWTPAPEELLGQSEFNLFKRDYEATDKRVQETLTAIKSDTGSLSTRINDVKSTADGNKTTISNVQSTLVNKADKSELSKYATTTSLNQVKQTADGNETLIAKIRQTPTSYLADYQKLINRANLVERTLGTTDSAVGDNISRMVQTSGIIQSEVESAVPNPNLLSGTDFKGGLGDVGVYSRTPTLSEVSYFPYGKVATINTPETSGTANLGFSVRIPKKDTWYTLSFYGLTNWVGSKGVSFYSMYMKDSKNYKAPIISGSSPIRHKIQITVQVTQDDAPLFVRPQGNAFGAYSNIVYYGVKLEVGEVATPWENSDPATSSKITQLADNINLKVSKDDISNQININTQGVVIQGNKIALSGQTSVDGAFWAKQVNAIKVNADNITTGTLDASKVKVVNIDANNITANKTSFVRSVWNSLESSIRIDSGGLLSTASDGSQVYLQNGIVGARDPKGATIGQIGYVYDGGSPTYTIQTSWGSNFAINQRFYDTYTKGTKNKEALSMYTTDDGYSETTIRMSRINILGDAHLSFLFRHSINGSDNNRLTVNGAESVALRARDTTIFVVSNNGSTNFSSLHANLNMQGNTVTNTSDIRLKRDIVNDEIDSLSALMKWQHAGFNYINPDMNQDRQFSVIAQSAPDIAFTGEDGYLQVALNKQVNMTSHSLQQHVIKTNNKVEQLEAKIASLQEELALLKGD